MKNQTLFMAVALIVAASQPVPASEENKNFEAVEAKLRSIAPSATTVALSETPIEGLLQAQVNSEIVYISTDGSYLLQGTLIEVDTRANLTDQAKSVIRKEKIQSVDETQMIAFAPAEPDYELMVFTDIDCGYCRKLHDQINEYMEAGIAIRYMAFPRAGIGSHSYDKFVSVWCADDQQEALTLAKAGSEPVPLQCDNPIEYQYQLGLDVGVTGTPALMTTEGMLIPGYMPPEALKQRLDAIKADLASAQ